MGNEPVVIVDSGSSYTDKEDRESMLRDQIHAQQCEINALRKALMYASDVKTLVDALEFYTTTWDDGALARKVLRK